MSKSTKKRSHEQLLEDDDPPSEQGVGDVLRRLQEDDADANPQVVSKRQRQKEIWTKHKQESIRKEKIKRENERSEKKKEKGNNRPTLTYAKAHKINSSLSIPDLRNLILYCIADGAGPQWISIAHRTHIRKVVVLMVPGLERAMFTGEISLEPSGNEVVEGDLTGDTTDRPMSTDKQPTTGQKRFPDRYLPVTLAKDDLPTPLKPLADIFTQYWPTKAAGDDKYSRLHSPIHSILNAPVPKMKEEEYKDKKRRDKSRFQQSKTPITEFIASKDLLLENEYTLHPALFESKDEMLDYSTKRISTNTSTGDGWADTRVSTLAEASVPEEDIQQGSITEGRTVYSIDCEMCKVEGEEFALTRVSVIGWDGEIVMDEYVKPAAPIIDYLTQYSGITAALLENVTTTLNDVQEKLLAVMTPQSIIVGHSLDSDLKALKMTHPFVVDTALLYPHPRGPPLKSSLKWLAQKYLDREIQRGHGAAGHDSTEDARATLDLVRLKCENGPLFGGSSETETIFKRLSRQPRTASVGAQIGKTGAIVDHRCPGKGFSSMASFGISCGSDTDVVNGVARAVSGDPDGAEIPGGGVDFTWARLKELEILRGWANDNRQNTESALNPPADPDAEVLIGAVGMTVQHIVAIKESLPPCTLFIVYSGTGDPRELSRMQELQRQFKREYAVKKWDQLTVKWTDTEEQALRSACSKARESLAFLTIT